MIEFQFIYWEGTHNTTLHVKVWFLFIYLLYFVIGLNIVVGRVVRRNASHPQNFKLAHFIYLEINIKNVMIIIIWLTWSYSYFYDYGIYISHR